FDWDISDEVDWLLERLGPDCRTVLEPGCGSGGVLEALAERALQVAGIDLSEQMLDLARSRLRGRGTVLLADMVDFDLGEAFDAAVCPINKLTLLTPDALARHLECMDRHLQPGSRYVVQVGVVDPEQQEPFAGSHWEAARDGTELKI